MTREDLISRSETAAGQRPNNGSASESVAFLLEGLRLAVLACAADPAPDVQETQPEVWARVELFGHTVRYGRVYEIERYGRRWLELVEPELLKEEDGYPDVPERRKLYHPNSVYALEEISEVDVRRSLRILNGNVHPGDDGEWDR